jgi:protein-tyrosine kinase
MSKEMKSLIEQAALRLEQLRDAGVQVPELASVPVLEVDAAQAQLTPADVSKESPATLSKTVHIDLDALAAAGIVTPNAPRTRIADEFRLIKRPLIANAQGKGASIIDHGNLIVVTSALPGEGKTFTAINLAMSIASELDCTVMLVDADVERPSVMKVLGLPAGPGLMDLLLDESSDLSDMLLKTNIEKLTLLPSGTPHPRATELLASEAMARLLDGMATRYADRIIVFDSPPLLLATESRVLASHMGQIVVVVQAEKTRQADVVQALATVEHCPVKSVLLNQARTASDARYGYGYGYGHA